MNITVKYLSAEMFRFNLKHETFIKGSWDLREYFILRDQYLFDI